MPGAEHKSRRSLKSRLKKFFGGKKRTGAQAPPGAPPPPGVGGPAPAPSGGDGPTPLHEPSGRTALTTARRGLTWQHGARPEGPGPRPVLGGHKLDRAGKQSVPATPLAGPNATGVELESAGKQSVAPSPLGQASSEVPAPAPEQESAPPGSGYITAPGYQVEDDDSEQLGTVASEEPAQVGSGYDVGSGSDVRSDTGDGAAVNVISTSSSEAPVSESSEVDAVARLERRDAKRKYLQKQAKAAWLVAHPEKEATPQEEGDEPEAKPPEATPEEAPGNGYTVDGGDSSSSYSVVGSDYSVAGSEDGPGFISSSTASSQEPETDKIEIKDHEIDALKTSDMQMEVQERYVGDPSAAPETQVLQTNLREHAKRIGGGPAREGKSKNEARSEGWATVGLLKGHKDLDGSGKVLEEDTTWQVKYYFNETEDLTTELAKKLGGSQHSTRGELVIQYDQGEKKWVDADKQAFDTSDAEPLAQTINARFKALRQKRDALKGQVDTPGDMDGKAYFDLVRRFHILRDKLANVRTHKSIAGHYIFAMNAAGAFFAAKGLPGIMHHSSFLAGGAVAAAGEIGIAGGVTNHLSNQSGHYRPGPAYLWQAVKQMQLLGVPLDFKVEVALVKKKMPAHTFLGLMNPDQDPTWFDSDKATKRLNGEGDGDGGEGDYEGVGVS